MVDQTPSSKLLRVDSPTRGADRNQTSLNDMGRSRREDLLLPSLDDGITLLDVGGRAVQVLQSLVLDHLLMHSGPAYWIDARGHAMTTSLARLTPSQRLLDRIHVARGFTAFQHFSLMDHLTTAVSKHVRNGAAVTESEVWEARGEVESQNRDRGSESLTPALIVAPDIDALYRRADALEREQAETLQSRSLALLQKYTDGFDVPVLVTRTQEDEFTAPVKTTADHHLRCEITDLGPRFVGDEFETKLYPVGDGVYQTTLEYWRELLESRVQQVGLSPAPSSPSPPTDTGPGDGRMMDGSDRSLNPNPLHEALSADRGW